jgi:hypothetical protein
MIQIINSYSGTFGQIYEGLFNNTYFKVHCVVCSEMGDCYIANLEDIETEYINKEEIRKELIKMGLIYP